MPKLIKTLFVTVALLLALCLAAPLPAGAEPSSQQVPVPGKATLLAVVAPWCRPCNEYLPPVLSQVEQYYQGQVAVVSKNINPDLYDRYGGQVPILIFFDKQGQQFNYILGTYSAQRIESTFRERGIKKPSQP